MIKLQEITSLLHIAPTFIEATDANIDGTVDLNFIDLSFRSLTLYQQFHELCQAQYIKFRRLANKKKFASSERYADDQLYAKRLRVKRIDLINYFNNQTDMPFEQSALALSLDNGLNLLALRLFVADHYAILAKIDINATNQVALVYQVNQQPIKIQFISQLPAKQEHKLVPKLTMSLTKETDETLLDQIKLINANNLNYESISTLNRFIKELNADLDKIEQTNNQSAVIIEN